MFYLLLERYYKSTQNCVIYEIYESHASHKTNSDFITNYLPRNNKILKNKTYSVFYYLNKLRYYRKASLIETQKDKLEKVAITIIIYIIINNYVSRY